MIKPIENYDGYFISDEGKVYCNLGKGNRRNGKTVELYEIAPRYTKTGYARVYLRNNETGKRKDLYIHRLVAEYFLQAVPNKKYVNHKNCIRLDNRVSNLEWCTVKENTAQTEKLKHIVRNERGQYVSNFDYQGRVQEIKERVLHL
jgi:hypothetical protein